MVNKTDNELEQAMLKILAGLEQTSRDMKEKRDKKFWANIEVPFTLLEGLSRYTKDELDVIRKYLDLKNASSLRKAELITRLEEALPYYLETVCLELDEERFGMLIKMARNGGFISAPDIEAEQISYLRANGVVYSGTFNGKRVLALPTEFINPILALAKDTKIIATVSKNTEWIKLTHGLLYYYGTLDMYQLSDLLETYTNETLRLREYLHVMHIANSYRKEHDADAVGWSNIRVLDPKQVKQEHKKRKNLSFYPFTKEQLLQAGEPEFVDLNESYQSLVEFILDHYAISREDADSLAEECVYATRIGDGPGDVLGFLEETLEFDSLETVQALMDQVVNLMNNTRQWFLKGYTPNELSEQKQEIPQALPKVVNQQTVRNVEKVGRNDPCPCGSGKKYKKCCGR